MNEPMIDQLTTEAPATFLSDLERLENHIHNVIASERVLLKAQLAFVYATMGDSQKAREAISYARDYFGNYRGPTQSEILFYVVLAEATLSRMAKEG